MTEKEKIEACNGCWYCDNIINCPDNVGLLYLGFPRCMMIIPNLKELLYNSYDDLIKVASSVTASLSLFLKVNFHL